MRLEEAALNHPPLPRHPPPSQAAFRPMAWPRVGFIGVDKSPDKLLGARADKWLKIFGTMNIPTRASAFDTCVVPIQTVKPPAAVATEAWQRGGDVAFRPATRGVIRGLGDGGHGRI